MHEMTDIEKAFEPRDKDGHKIPMVREDGTDLAGNPCYLAYMKPRPDGAIDPMAFIEDVENGRVGYAPGVSTKPFGVGPDGVTTPLDLQAVRYYNPVLNLPQLYEEMVDNGIPQYMMPAAQRLGTFLMTRGITNLFEPDDSDEEYYGLHVTTPTGTKCRVCNFVIKVEQLRCVMGEGKPKFEIAMILTKRSIYGRRTEHAICVPEAELAHLDGYLSASIPAFCLASETPRASQLLVEHIRNRLDEVPRVVIFNRSGWTQYEDRHVFVHAGMPAFSNVKSECEQVIVSEKMSPSDAFTAALGILGIGKQEVLLPLMLTALLGPLFQMFADAGYVPRFVTYLYGLSGSLKTAVSLVFYRFFKGQKHSSFRDTPAAIDVAVGEHRDQMLLVDDFQPAVVAAQGAEMRKTLEHLVRLYGDDIAKKRSNSRATATYGKGPRGSCLITGESISGSYSSLLRCLLVPISRGDIDGQLLRRYQERPGLWATNYIYFLPWIGTNWKRLMNKIRAEFPNWRQHFSSVTNEPRLVDTGAVLMLVGEIFLMYGTECGALNRDYVQYTLEEWRAVIEVLLDTTAGASQELDVAELARESIAGAMTDESLKIAPDINSFVGKMDGFVHKDLFWIKPRSMDRVLQQYCTDNQVSSVRGTKVILPELYKRGMITRDDESGKNSFLKRSPQIPALETRLRMVAFHCDQLFKEP